MSRSLFKFDDIDLMQYVDGELEDETLSADIERGVEADEEIRAKVQALEQIREGTRTHLELAADQVEPRLHAMWAEIERGIAANGAQAAVPAVGLGTTEARPEAREDRRGLWAAISDWLGAYRGHFLTGAVAAGAAAALILTLQPPTQVIVERPVIGNGHSGGNVAIVNQDPTTHDPSQSGQVLLVNDSSPPAIEHLEVTGGSGSVFVIPSEGEDDVEATVIFMDTSDVEGPL